MPKLHHFIYNERPVAYRTTGSGQPVLVLHGWGSSSQVMLPLAESLSPHFKLYLLDFPGFGSSEVPATAWSIDEYANLVEAFILHLNLAEVDVIAHSFGGRVMLKLCARPFGQQYIKRVLLTGGAGMKPKRTMKFYFRKYLAKTLKAPFMLLPQPLQERGLAKLRSTTLWKSLGSGEYSQLQGVMREIFVKTVTEFLEPCLPKIPHEVLLLWGTQDDTTPLYQAERMKKGIKKAELISIDDAGHYAFLDQPLKFKLISEAFLKA